MTGALMSRVGHTHSSLGSWVRMVFLLLLCCVFFKGGLWEATGVAFVHSIAHLRSDFWTAIQKYEIDVHPS